MAIHCQKLNKILMKTEIKRLSIILLIVLCVNLNVKAGGFWQSLWNGISSPFRPVWGSYKVSGQNNSAPIALFKRTTFEKDKKDIIDRIKIENSDFSKIYLTIFKKATNIDTYTIPASSGAAQTYENRATFAKNAAFVLVLGVKIRNQKPDKKCKINYLPTSTF
jgi:hypothetical protein